MNNQCPILPLSDCILHLSTFFTFILFPAPEINLILSLLFEVHLVKGTHTISKKIEIRPGAKER